MKTKPTVYFEKGKYFQFIGHVDVMVMGETCPESWLGGEKIYSVGMDNSEGGGWAIDIHETIEPSFVIIKCTWWSWDNTPGYNYYLAKKEAFKFDPAVPVSGFSNRLKKALNN